MRQAGRASLKASISVRLDAGHPVGLHFYLTSVVAMSISLESLGVFVSQSAVRPGMWVSLPASVGEFAAAIAGCEAALCDAGIGENEARF